MDNPLDNMTHRRQGNIDQAFHVWINERQDERRKAKEPFEKDLYEFKRALAEVDRLPRLLKAARTSTLPTMHQQCSHSAPIPIVENRLVCALGVDVTQCPILASVYASAARERFPEGHRLAEFNVTPDDADVIAGRVCTWHILMESQKRSVDTSEGYLKDESDRMYWSRVYESLSWSEDDEPFPDPPYGESLADTA